MYYTTMTEMKQNYKAKLREWERQMNYERNIVQSIPERVIEACSVELDNTERWKPG